MVHARTRLTGFLDLLALPRATPAFRTALVHMTLNLLVTGTCGVNFLWRYGNHTDGGRVGVGRLVLSAVSVAVLGLSGYPGGKLAYRYGVRVADENTQAEGYPPGRGASRSRPSARPRPAHPPGRPGALALSPSSRPLQRPRHRRQLT
ncbi:DUF2231 domain-containing protein [Streptomyces qaidamensis]|uniref:DUF2231 domain-containing protein n=1 Tax=Streptomyces qaidamensis TaxID=1783515 RepID=UPI00099FA145|nr:DUF2231 domain-containing protein [Streptomyces qaidamensis]